MFDVGFWELAIIGVVALLIIGPERLPAAARTAGLWLGKARRMLSDVKADINRELKEQDIADLGALQDDLQGTGAKFKQATADLHASARDASAAGKEFSAAFQQAAPDNAPAAAPPVAGKKTGKKTGKKAQAAKQPRAAKSSVKSAAKSAQNIEQPDSARSVGSRVAKKSTTKKTTKKRAARKSDSTKPAKSTKSAKST